MSRICPEKGLHQLLDAWKLLATDPGLPPVVVRAAGYLDPADRPYLADLERKVAAWGLADRFQYLGELDRGAKIAFLQSLDMLSLPTVSRESKGLAVIEAWANGVPAVLPAHGAFSELLADTGGGLLYAPGDPAALAAGLRQMIEQPGMAAECGRRRKRRSTPAIMPIWRPGERWSYMRNCWLASQARSPQTLCQRQFWRWCGSCTATPGRQYNCRPNNR